ncbi:MAG: DUF983 domain-containing protein [Dehalococcoidia bacterium]|nr:DUF983 domain-containing protein [Dehalococcoidia bacterium]
MSAVHTFWRTGILRRCPECGQTSMFNSFYGLHERCAVCGTRFESSSGEWLGGPPIGYAIGALVALALALIEGQWSPLGALGLPSTWTIAALSLVATVLCYRPAKAIWFALLYEWGFMARGDGPPTGAPPRAGR